MKFTYLISVFIFLTFQLFAQNIEFEKENFESNKDGLKEAQKNIKEGDKLFETGYPGNFRIALDFYLLANKFNPQNALLNYRIGSCYLYSYMESTKCLDFFSKAYSLNKNISEDILYLLARAYHINYKFDDAIKNYTAYRNILSPKQLEEERKDINKKIEECKNGIELIKNPVRVFIDNVGDAINSTYSEYSPLISADESMMIFTSRRNNTTGEGKDPGDQQYFEDVYVSYQENGQWSQARNIGSPINTNANDATVGLAPDGQQLFIFNEGDIYKCELKGELWSKPKMLPKTINTVEREGDASFSYNGKTMFIASERTDKSFGGFDIYYSIQAEKEKWGEVQNLGSVINTEYDDRSVFMHPDGKTLYFSSRGHNTMGGYDIFYSTKDDNGNWTKPVNIGYPINTPEDDLFFVLSASGKHGYYSSAKEGGVGTYDIYMITFRGPEKPIIQNNEDNLIASAGNPMSEVIIQQKVELKTMRLTILKGTVKDDISSNPIEATIEIVDNAKNELISTFTSNSATGKFLVSLPSGKNYGIAVKAEGYLFHSENFDIPAATNYQEINKDIRLKKASVGTKIVLRNIFFDLAKATLRAESNTELDRLIGVMTDNPTIKIEISGHTDNQGSLDLNTKLSEARAKAVVDYLIAKGVDASRLTYKGYAFSQPISPNDTEAGRQDNRRVEFKIMSNQ